VLFQYRNVLDICVLHICVLHICVHGNELRALFSCLPYLVPLLLQPLLDSFFELGNWFNHIHRQWFSVEWIYWVTKIEGE
jgi:hypothetical protein